MKRKGSAASAPPWRRRGGAHLVGCLGGLEGHGVLELPLRRLGQLDAEHLGELLLRQLQAQRLERGVQVRVVPVPVPRHVLEDLLQRVRFLGLQGDVFG